MREADKTDTMKPQDRIFRMGERSSERKRCDSFVNSLFEEANDAGVLNASPEDDAEVVIKMWKNGFTINDGQLRDYTDAANRQFMDSMRKGELPPELHKTFEKKEVSVNVEDRKSEEYFIRKKLVDPFSGQGHRLGSATPKLITKIENGDEQVLSTVVLDAKEPQTNIKIWLSDGKRIVQKFNTTHRISDVRNFVERLPCKSEKIPFTLATSFPLRDLLDESVTIQEAQLQNAVLVQRQQKTTEPLRDS
ncbi:UBX domain-containing protein 2A [Hyla sarda]|uniref:UBX domain-containing protein 2A n=1 Tax=Hyla sarda TaxID=327740 RepID=UPI0024C27B4B|nr:UBX domain-containing protein 2A [Hyla sarda]XP_056420304.1 UBX domain-containing protein 2A [Hyla sarda]XP_056420305.1 UBX domain-containing protein 2A [Hyla sarda]